MSLSKELLSELITKSAEVKKNAYNVYSNFRVGSAVLCEDGSIITGVNVENASISLTICAERSAICSAVSQGHRKFKAVIVSSDMPDTFISPCGACRQFISEFGQDIEVYTTKLDGSYQMNPINQLLPFAFLQSDMKGQQQLQLQLQQQQHNNNKDNNNIDDVNDIKKCLNNISVVGGDKNDNKVIASDDFDDYVKYPSYKP